MLAGKDGSQAEILMLNTNYIKQRREALGLTQQQAADAAGLSDRQRWYSLECGRVDNPELFTLLGIARALRCRLDDLVTKLKPV